MVPAGFSAQISQSCLSTPLGPLAAPNLDRSVAITTVNLQFLYYLVLAEALLVASFIDFDLQIIPDSVTLPAAIIGFGPQVYKNVVLESQGILENNNDTRPLTPTLPSSVAT